MAATIPNITLEAGVITNIFQTQQLIDAGVSVGTAITIEMLGGSARLFIGASAPEKIDDDSGYEPSNLYNETSIQRGVESGDAGAFMYSLLGAKVNVSLA